MYIKKEEISIEHISPTIILRSATFLAHDEPFVK